MVTVSALLLLTAAVWHDLRRREIPDWIPVALIVVGLAGSWLDAAPFVGTASPVPTWGARAFGLGLGFAIGLALFYGVGFGGGDAKLVCGLGFALGPWPLLVVLFWTALAGAVLAIAATRSESNEFAYAPAFLAGFVASWVHFGVQAA
jgi:Flp pilus assembly protein protease CpaA